MSNYTQPDYRNPTTPVDSLGHPLGNIGVQVENKGNPLNITGPQPTYIQAGTSVSQPGWAGQAPPGPNSSPTVV